MKLVMMYNKPYLGDIGEVSGMLGMKHTDYEFMGESLTGIERGLFLESEKEVFVLSSDSRMLKFVHRYIDLDDVYVYDDEGTGELYKLSDATSRILRVGHHLPNLFEAGEFRV